jgi:radical SAM protein with 4Fe4S-binding SPASM domain
VIRWGAALLDRTRRRLGWAHHRLEHEILIRTHPLRYLFLEVTRRCNLACVYCGSDCGPRVERSELSVAEWIGVARQVATDFVPRRIMMAVTGGEPLLKPGVFDLFLELERLGFRWGLVTNGLLLDRAAARRLVASGLRSISLSLDAPPDLNDQLRGTGSARRVGEAIEHLRGAGYGGRLEILSTVTSPVVPLLEATRRHVSALRVRHWRLVPAMPIGRAASRPDLVPGPRDLEELMRFIRAGRSDRMVPAPELCEEGYLGEDLEGRVRPYLFQCRAGITVAGVSHDGGIGACPELGAAFQQGQIPRDRLRDVWEERYQIFRDRSWTRGGVCRECAAYPRCRGGSLHLYARPSSPLQRCFHLMLEQARAERAAAPISNPGGRAC